ncbi:MAG: LptF/LptG family permease [Candidatus Obscuribacterales bacterium]|nr:LptF/LptG family permease [Candidatus Obscuribacterales bacterium]
MNLLDRYCFYQFFVMLMIGTTVPGGIYLLTDEVQRLMRYVAEAGCPLDLLLTMTALQIPATVVTCLPAGVLIATVLSLYFLIADSELLALRTAGISLLRVMRPFIAIGILCSLFSFVLAEELVPDALRLSNSMAMSAVNNRELPSCRGIHDYVGYESGPDGKLKTIYLVASRNGRKLFNNILIDLSSPEYIRLIWAPTGLFKNQYWNLYDGHIYNIFSKGLNAGDHVHFGKLLIGPPDLSRFDPKKREARPYELNSKQLRAKIDALCSSGKPVSSELWLEFFRRYSDPLSCFFLLIAALPVALFGHRGKNMFSLAYGGIVFVSYFVLRDICMGLVNGGGFDPLLGAWLPGLSFAGLGLLMLLLGRRRF